MSSSFAAAVEKAAAILLAYRHEHGDHAFPTIKGKLWPIVEHAASLNGVHQVRVQRFNEPMRPIVGQVRRMTARAAQHDDIEVHGMIYLCPSLELDLQRWVQMKEAGHLLMDEQPDFVTNDVDIDRLLTTFAQFDIKVVEQQFLSEMRAMVFANEVLFPFATRALLKKDYDAARIAPGVIAGHAGIPTEIVRHVMSEDYWSVAERLNTDLVKGVMAGKVRLARG